MTGGQGAAKKKDLGLGLDLDLDFLDAVVAEPTSRRPTNAPLLLATHKRGCHNKHKHKHKHPAGPN
jgi:hypothetical protein